MAEVSDDADRSEPGLDDFLEDLGRFEPETYERWPEVYDDRWMDAPLPPGIDLPRNRLGAFLGRPRPGAIDLLRRRIRSKFAGSPSASTTTGFVPPPDALAVYLPFHLFLDMWGIYLLDVGVESLAADIRYIAKLLGRSISPMDARRVSCAYLFHHEAYHCAVESFSVRCELPTRKPVYKTGAMRLYNRGYVHGAPHEEALATAYGIRKVKAHVLLPRPDLDVAVQALKVYMTLCQPAYSTGLEHLDDIQLDGLERIFVEEVMRVSSGRALPHSTWDIGTFMMTPLIQGNRSYSWICSRADFYNRSRLAVHYFRRNNVIACLERVAGAHPEAGGKHLHLVRTVGPSGQKRRTQVPSGEVHKGTLSGMLDDLGIDLNVSEFRDACRRARRAL